MPSGLLPGSRRRLHRRRGPVAAPSIARWSRDFAAGSEIPSEFAASGRDSRGVVQDDERSLFRFEAGERPLDQVAIREMAGVVAG